MKTREEIQRTWDTEWFTPIADGLSLSSDARAEIRQALRKEIFWLATLNQEVDLQEILSIRITKIQTIMDANDGSAASFDVFYSYRKQFFEWAAI